MNRTDPQKARAIEELAAKLDSAGLSTTQKYNLASIFAECYERTEDGRWRQRVSEPALWEVAAASTYPVVHQGWLSIQPTKHGPATWIVHQGYGDDIAVLDRGTTTVKGKLNGYAAIHAARRHGWVVGPGQWVGREYVHTLAYRPRTPAAKAVARHGAAVTPTTRRRKLAIMREHRITPARLEVYQAPGGRAASFVICEHDHPDTEGKPCPNPFLVWHHHPDPQPIGAYLAELDRELADQGAKRGALWANLAPEGPRIYGLRHRPGSEAERTITHHISGAGRSHEGQAR